MHTFVFKYTLHYLCLLHRNKIIPLEKKIQKIEDAKILQKKEQKLLHKVKIIKNSTHARISFAYMKE